MKCKFCEQRATRILPQSIDEGVTVVMIVACGAHAAGWWGAADWDGRHLERELLDEPNVIVFHEQGGVDGQMWDFIDGHIGRHIAGNGEKKMLCPHLCAEVENLAMKGDYSGVTSDPIFTSWKLLYAKKILYASSVDFASSTTEASPPSAELVAMFESQISQKLQEDPMLTALRTTIECATRALHLRENELVAQTKNSLGLGKELTEFECLLGERQIGVL